MGRYMLFTRMRYEDALSYQGALEAPTDEAAQARAREQFGEQWLEVVLAPESAIFWLLKPQAELEAPL